MVKALEKEGRLHSHASGPLAEYQIRQRDQRRGTAIERNQETVQHSRSQRGRTSCSRLSTCLKRRSSASVYLRPRYVYQHGFGSGAGLTHLFGGPSAIIIRRAGC